eukprot:8791577-Lingulodinium_polyedra.AAC.1
MTPSTPAASASSGQHAVRSMRTRASACARPGSTSWHQRWPRFLPAPRREAVPWPGPQRPGGRS